MIILGYYKRSERKIWHSDERGSRVFNLSLFSDIGGGWERRKADSDNPGTFFRIIGGWGGEGKIWIIRACNWEEKIVSKFALDPPTTLEIFKYQTIQIRTNKFQFTYLRTAATHKTQINNESKNWWDFKKTSRNDLYGKELWWDFAKRSGNWWFWMCLNGQLTGNWRTASGQTDNERTTDGQLAEPTDNGRAN